MRGDIIRQDLEEIFGRESIPWKRFDGKTVLITGAYGMIASYMVYMLIYLNEVKKIHVHIIAMARSAEKFKARFPEAFRYSYLDLVTDSIYGSLIFDGKIDYIIHTAGLASPQYYKACPVDVLMPNVIGSYNLLELAYKKGTEGFLMFSTGDIYGKVQGNKRITENEYGTIDPLDIHSCYGESKRMAETMCMSWFLQKGVPAKIARIWHTYAPTMDYKNDPRVFASFVNDIINQRDIVMLSDGSAMRSFCYITDAVAGYFLILLKGKDGEAYNVCNASQFLSISQLAQCMASIYPDMGIKVVRKQRGQADSYLENPNAGAAIPDSRKLEKLGWKAEVPVSDGFKRVIDSNFQACPKKEDING